MQHCSKYYGNEHRNQGVKRVLGVFCINSIAHKCVNTLLTYIERYIAIYRSTRVAIKQWKQYQVGALRLNSYAQRKPTSYAEIIYFYLTDSHRHHAAFIE